jgi:2-C-methyl-D-erythritol 4-phosphate cytidylyltransferase
MADDALDNMKVALIVPAAGSGSRYSESGGLRSKLDEDLGGRPVLQRTLEAFVNHPEIGPLIKAIIVPGPHDPESLAEFKQRHGDRLGIMGAHLCQGGSKERYESVQAALKMLASLPIAAEITHIAVHDAARPCVSAELISRVFDRAARATAVIPAVDVSDTLKKVRDEEVDQDDDDPVSRILGGPVKPATRRVVVSAVDRSNLVQVQTPQVFHMSIFQRAYAQKDLSSTDDAGLVERLGETVQVVAGDVRNVKITRSQDLSLARAILGVSGPAERPVHKRF